MKRLLICLLTVFAVIGGFAQPSRGERHNPDQEKERGGFPRETMHRLNLTEDQQKQIEHLRSVLRKSEIDLNAKIASKKVDIEELFRAQTPDKMKIDESINQAAQLRGEAARARVAFWFDVNKILTSDQQKIWHKIGLRILHRRNRMMEHRPHFRMREKMMRRDQEGSPR